MSEQTSSQSSQSEQSSKDAERRADLELARSVLRGKEASALELYKLAERLKDRNEFGYARRLYGRIRSLGTYASLTETAVKVGQRHALCTYKDPDLPAADRFRRALEILDEVDLLNLTGPERQESLGLRGAIHKRRFQVEGQRMDLERALAYYLRGHAIGAEHDQGYTGINAAFVLDLMAREDADQAAKAGASSDAAVSRWVEARSIRQELVGLLPALPSRVNESGQPTHAWLKGKWWFYATLAEAHFGLGEFDPAIAALRDYNKHFGLEDEGPPLMRVAPWELESTLSQLATLAQLQADLAERLSGRPELEAAWPIAADADRRVAEAMRSRVRADEIRGRAEHALRGYLGRLEPAVDRLIDGKLGLALSGGGFRASLFHIGVLAYLSERDVLRRVEALSCVSGGSIVGAHYYLEVQRLLESKGDAEIARVDYVALVQSLEREFLAGVQTNIRGRVFSSIWANLRAFFQPGYTATRRLGELYETEFYARVQDGRQAQPRYLGDLLVTPKDDPGLKPKYDNWRRRAKVPVLVLNAATLNTGHSWQFTASYMGEPPSSIDAEIEGNYRLRRMYYWEAPRLADRWRGTLGRLFGPPDYQHFRLGDAVAASSCVPGLFDPILLPDLFEGKTVRLVDGGVYDNQGMASLLEQDCNVLIVSDASGQMEAQDHPSGSRIGVPLRSFSVSMSRVRQAQYRELAARRRAGLLKGLMFLHLRKDLDADPLDWRECQDPYDASDQARPAAARGVLTGYGIQKTVQRLLSAIRTDLDSFTEVEAFALMTSGYRMAEAELEALQGFPAAVAPPEGWRFLKIEPALAPGPGYDELLRQLRIGAGSFAKVWRLWWPLTILGIAILALLAFALVKLWLEYRSVTLLTVHSLGVALLVLVATLAVPQVVRIVRFHSTLRDLGLRSLVAAVLGLAIKVHLALFDPIFLRLGCVSRLLKMRKPGSK